MVALRAAEKQLRSSLPRASVSDARTAWQDDMPFVRTADGTRLYVKDWGSGRPVLADTLTIKSYTTCRRGRTLKFR